MNQQNTPKLSKLLAGAIVTALFVACGSGNSANSSLQQLVINSNESEAKVFSASIGTTAVHTYQALINSNASPAMATYAINVNLPGSQFSLESNTCSQVPANQLCNIQIGFTPASQNDYSADNVLSFSVGSLESSIVVLTQAVLN